VIRLFTIDRGGFQPLLALRGAAGVAIPVAVGTAAGHPAEGVIAAAGALPAGVAGFGGGFRTRAGLIVATGLGMSMSTFVGSLAAGHTWLMVMALLVWGAAAGITVVLGREATIIGTQAVIGLVVFGRFPGSVSAAAVHAGWVFAGAALQGLLAAVVRPPTRFSAERRTLAQAYSELADLARDPNRSSLTATSEAAMSAVLIGRRAPGEDVDILRGLADEANRIRLELQSLATVLSVPSVGDATRAAAAWLDAVSTSIRSAKPAASEDARLDNLVEHLRRQRDEAPAGRAGTPTRYAAARTAALLGQLRAVDRLTSALAGVRRFALPRRLGAPVFVAIPQRAADGVRQIEATAKDPRSPAFRHAVRLAVVLPTSELLSHALPWQRGYWITLTAVVVLKPDYAATAQRGLERVGGTAIGVLAAGLLIATTHPSGSVLVLLIALATWAAYTCFAASYALYSIAVTAIVVLLLAPFGGDELSTVADRGLDTIVGGALALIAYLLWPTWERATLDDSLSKLLRALAAYTDLLLAAYAEPSRYDAGALTNQASIARRARMSAMASYDRAMAEPARAGTDLDRAGGTLAATRRIVIELHALRATISDAQEFAAVPEVNDIRDAIVESLGRLAGDETVAVTDLRAMQEALAAESLTDRDSLHERRRLLLAAHLDPLVDSVDTLAHVLNRESP